MEDDQLIPAPTEHPRADPNWKRAGLKLIPYIGDALDELAFGQVEEARWDRLNQTLSELGESMQRLEISADAVKKEDFAQLLEVVAPAAGRTTSEQKRSLLRDLLLNAVPLGDGDAEWESARMAAELIVALEAPALTILAVLAQVGARGDLMAELRSVDGGNSAEVVCKEPPGVPVPVNYNWHVVDQAYRKLSSTPARLVIAGSRGLDRIDGTSLTSLGEFVIEWATAPL